MANYPWFILRIFRRAARYSASRQETSRLCHLLQLPSRHLARTVRVEVFLPVGYDEKPKTDYPLLLLNDGQDMAALGMADILRQLYESRAIRPLLVAAIHTSGERIQEYGVSGHPDYKQRGAKAGDYARFVMRELLPALKKYYRCSPSAQDWAIAGFSLGGLSAFDIGWHYAWQFSKIGVFSGSFWWRAQAFDPSDPDSHRILIDVLRRSRPRSGLRFWLQAGTLDEESDRNQNGIIDAIDDTLDVIRELERLGYRLGKDIHYVQVEGGRHDLPTWAKVMPDFLCWAFGVLPGR